ncbi:hypothetical protein [Crateriforma conspicua]|uniref:hypothetical protein n=1 Tax=Crateriforma conspicua TaxID=2527996 RepID=UPI0018CC7CB9|nr:hypothetical protein [Crateriforma conspicua]
MEQEKVVAAEVASVEALQATIDRIQADIDDSELKAPRDGRMQYRVAQPGEVLNPGWDRLESAGCRRRA